MKRSDRIDLMRRENIDYHRWLWKLAPEHHGKSENICRAEYAAERESAWRLRRVFEH